MKEVHTFPRAIDIGAEGLGVGFAARGITVVDPWLDDEGMRQVDPRDYYGFREESPAPGLSWLQLEDEDGYCIVLTDNEGGVPEGPGHPWAIFCFPPCRLDEDPMSGDPEWSIIVAADGTAELHDDREPDEWAEAVMTAQHARNVDALLGALSDFHPRLLNGGALELSHERWKGQSIILGPDGSVTIQTGTPAHQPHPILTAGARVEVVRLAFGSPLEPLVIEGDRVVCPACGSERIAASEDVGRDLIGVTVKTGPEGEPPILMIDTDDERTDDGDDFQRYSCRSCGNRLARPEQPHYVDYR